MILEHLTTRVPVADQPAFLAADAAIWTATLAAQPGFLGKEVWRDADDPAHLHLIIRWASLADWKGIPQSLLAETDARFTAALGRAYPIESCTTHEGIG